jgi:hypothetical protein
MSLKGFHLIFILISVIFAFWFAHYEWTVYQAGRTTIDLVLSIGIGLVGLGLIVYGISFQRKAKKL